MIISCSLADF